MPATATPVSAAPLALVVEDEPLIRMELADLLTDYGFASLEAANAAQALQQLLDHPEVVLLVTDVQMPGPMQGFELAREVRQLNPSISIIVCSGGTTPGLGDMPPAALFIDKPLGAQALTKGLSALKLSAPPSLTSGERT